MKTIYILLFAVCFLGYRAIAQTTITCPVSSDTYINEALPGINFGDLGLIQTGTDAQGNNSIILLQFDLSQIPDNVLILSSTMTFHPENSTGTVNGKMYLVTSPWYEDSITWQNNLITVQPQVTVDFTADDQLLELDVLQLVNQWYTAGLQNNGIVMIPDQNTTNAMTSFYSKEYTYGYFEPEIEITYTELPPVPTSLFVWVAGPHTMSVNWDDVSNELGYILYRSNTPDGQYTEITTLPQNTTQYTDTTIQPYIQYCYKVKAYNESGTSPFSLSHCKTSIDAPAAPQWVNLDLVSVNQIDLEWENVESEEGYKIQRSVTSTGTFETIATTQADECTYTDNSPEPDREYCYRIKAFNPVGSSDFSVAECVYTIPAGIIQITSPNGGEIWQSGEVHNITWMDNIIDDVKIELLINNNPHMVITNSTASDGMYSWIVPNDVATGQDYRIRVLSVENNNLQDFSDTTFKIINNTHIVISRPNGGEAWQAGAIYDILWDPGIAQNVKIELYDADTLNLLISDQVTNNGSFAWEIPNNQAQGSDYYIKITDIAHPGEFDFSDSSFRILNPQPVPYITVASPNSGETWQTGLPQVITWIDNIDANIKIELYKSDTLFSVITNSTPSTGQYNWTVPTNQPSGADYRIKISSIDDSDLYDYSDATFTIENVGGINNPVFSNILIYPNPATDRITVKNMSLDTTIQKLKLINACGKEVLVINGTLSSVTTIPTAKISNGIYLLVLDTNKGILQTKIVIEK